MPRDVKRDLVIKASSMFDDDIPYSAKEYSPKVKATKEGYSTGTTRKFKNPKSKVLSNFQTQAFGSDFRRGPQASKDVGNFQTRGKQQLLESQTTRTKRSGAALLKSIKRRMLKGIPGNRNKSY